MLGCATPEDTRRLNRVLTGSLVLTVLAAAVWLGLALSGGSHAQALAQILNAGGWRVYLAWGGVALLLTLWLAIAFPERGVLVGYLALLIAWLTRWAIFMGGQGVSKIGQHYEDFRLSIGPDGLLGIIGTIGLCIAFYLVLATLLPWGDHASRPKGAST